MDNSSPELRLAAERIAAEVRRRIAGRITPFLIAIDGGSGSGKSTLAALLTEIVSGTMVQSDDFYAAEIPNAAWDARSPKERAEDAIDWRRLRREVLEPLLARQRVRWHPFDFFAGAREDGTYGMSSEFVEREPSDVIVLDGAYSTRPELADLIDYSILMDVPVAVRHQRLAAREDAQFLAEWHARWDVAEEYYFTQVRPPAAFDLVIRIPNCELLRAT